MYYKDTPKAWGRTRVLALGMGVDLAEATFEGCLLRAELNGLVAICASCRDVAACLCDAARLQAAPPPPAFCPNKSTLDALRG